MESRALPTLAVIEKTGCRFVPLDARPVEVSFGLAIATFTGTFGPLSGANAGEATWGGEVGTRLTGRTMVVLSHPLGEEQGAPGKLARLPGHVS